MLLDFFFTTNQSYSYHSLQKLIKIVYACNFYLLLFFCASITMSKISFISIYFSNHQAIFIYFEKAELSHIAVACGRKLKNLFFRIYLTLLIYLKIDSEQVITDFLM